MTAVGTPLVWGLFAAVVAVALAIDLGVFHREAHEARRLRRPQRTRAVCEQENGPRGRR